jgi:hypothetical protein
MADSSSPPALSPRAAAWQVAILLGLAAVAYAPELLRVIQFALRDFDAAHTLAAPLLVALLFLARRREITASLRRGSRWGIALIVLGILVTLAASWPFNHGLPRFIAILLVIAGIILALCGSRVLSLCLPLLLVLMLAIPIGTRLNAIATRRPERYTLMATGAAMEMLPGVSAVELRGPDLHFVTGERRGTIALGEPRRYVSMHFACLSLMVFVVFCRIRPRWQIVAAVLAAPLVLFACNLGRVAAWVLLSVYTPIEATSAWPRVVAAVVALLLAWALTTALLGVLSALVVDPDDAEGSEPADG